jgi:type I restriction enzyme R subunit
VLFVVDRKDLDYQTMREYERFEKGAANSNTSTAVLQRQLEDPNARIIITTIQKLSPASSAKNKKHPVYDAHVVVIFDECHRSQFGDMHAEITRVFKRYHLFGFTGTPIFAENAGTTATRCAHHRAGLWRQAAHLHHRRCHQRQERAAVPHRLHQHDQGRSIKDKQVSAIDTERRCSRPSGSPDRGYIREHFDQKTKRASTTARWQAAGGFNRCSPAPPSMRPNATTRNSPNSRRTCPRRNG